jgi:hypothetical protein
MLASILCRRASPFEGIHPVQQQHMILEPLMHRQNSSPLPQFTCQGTNGYLVVRTCKASAKVTNSVSRPSRSVQGRFARWKHQSWRDLYEEVHQRHVGYHEEGLVTP